MSDPVVTVRRRGAVWVAMADHHGLSWKAVGKTRSEAVAKARAAALSGVWGGEPITANPRYRP